MIRHTKTLFYCDGPQVIEARDDEAKDYFRRLSVARGQDQGQPPMRICNRKTDGILPAARTFNKQAARRLQSKPGCLRSGHVWVDNATRER